MIKNVIPKTNSKLHQSIYQQLPKSKAMDTIDNAKIRLKKADFFCIKLKKKDVKDNMKRPPRMNANRGFTV